MVLHTVSAILAITVLLKVNYRLAYISIMRLHYNNYDTIRRPIFRVVQKRGHSAFLRLSRKLPKIITWFLYTSRLLTQGLIIYLLKSGCPVSDRFAYSAPPTAAVSLGVACACRHAAEARSADSKQGQDDTERSDVSACAILYSSAIWRKLNNNNQLSAITDS